VKKTDPASRSRNTVLPTTRGTTKSSGEVSSHLHSERRATLLLSIGDCVCGRTTSCKCDNVPVSAPEPSGESSRVPERLSQDGRLRYSHQRATERVHASHDACLSSTLGCHRIFAISARRQAAPQGTLPQGFMFDGCRAQPPFRYRSIFLGWVRHRPLHQYLRLRAVAHP
jgi:hypothetical protein